MKPIRATSLSSDFGFPISGLIRRVDYSQLRLRIEIEWFKAKRAAIVEFSEVMGVRVLDERVIIEFWGNLPEGWLWQIHEGGWFSQEDERTGGYYSIACNAPEYLIAGKDDCVSVLARKSPKIEFVSFKSDLH